MVKGPKRKEPTTLLPEQLALKIVCKSHQQWAQCLVEVQVVWQEHTGALVHQQ